MKTHQPISRSSDSTDSKNPFVFEDEILKELYEVKAQMNREANYSVATLLANARAIRFPAREQPTQQQLREEF